NGLRFLFKKPDPKLEVTFTSTGINLHSLEKLIPVAARRSAANDALTGQGSLGAVSAHGYSQPPGQFQQPYGQPGYPNQMYPGQSPYPAQAPYPGQAPYAAPQPPQAAPLSWCACFPHVDPNSCCNVSPFRVTLLDNNPTSFGHNGLSINEHLWVFGG